MPRGSTPRPFWGSGEREAQQFKRVDANTDGEDGNLKIRDAADLSLNFGKRIPAHVPADQVQFGGEFGLGEAVLLAELAHHGANDISGRLHVPNPALDSGRICGNLCAEFGTESNPRERRFYVPTKTRSK